MQVKEEDRAIHRLPCSFAQNCGVLKAGYALCCASGILRRSTNQRASMDRHRRISKRYARSSAVTSEAGGGGNGCFARLFCRLSPWMGTFVTSTDPARLSNLERGHNVRQFNKDDIMLSSIRVQYLVLVRHRYNLHFM